MGRRRNKIGSFMDGFNSTYGTVRGVLRDNEMRKIADAKPEEQAQIRDANQDELARARAETEAIAAQDAATFAPQEGEAPLPAASDYGMGSQVQTGVKHAFLGKEYAEAPTDIQKNSARIAAQAGVLGKYGDPVASAQLRAAGITIDEAERKRSDNDELRAAMGGGVSSLNKPAGQGVNPAGVAATPGMNQAQPGAGPDDNGLDGYLKRVAPQAVQTMLKHGDLEGAKRFQDFTQSESGKAYASAWLGGVRRLAVGDNHGALSQFEKMYNDQNLYGDGKTVKLKPSADGAQYSLEQYDQAGTLLGSKTMPTADLAKNAALFLEPSKAVSFFAEQQAKRESESATLERQTQLEALRQKGQETRDDRRDDRTTMQINAMDGRLTRQLDAKGGLTLPQQRSNSEIQAAREAVTGLSQTEIARRTAKTSNTGRDNPDYDPGLAHHVALANRRKVGEDPEFDKFNAPKPQPAASNAGALNRANVAKSFRSDRAMDGYRLGRDVPDSKDVPGGGVEVLDKAGKVIGHYR